MSSPVRRWLAALGFTVFVATGRRDAQSIATSSRLNASVIPYAR